MKGKTIKMMSLIAVNVVLLVVLYKAYWNMKDAVSMMDFNGYNFNSMVIGLVFFAFGLLIEYNKIFEAITKRFSVNKIYLFIAIGLLIVSCLPVGSVNYMSFTVNKFMQTSVVSHILSIWSGVLLARSLVAKELHKEV